MVAMLFVLFDIEVVFMYPWAVQFRDLISGGNPTALASMAGFAGVLVVAYVYALKKGALNWKS
jgi:NADH-quinone oxidoreductase subunit A